MGRGVGGEPGFLFGGRGTGGDGSGDSRGGGGSRDEHCCLGKTGSPAIVGNPKRRPLVVVGVAGVWFSRFATWVWVGWIGWNGEGCGGVEVRAADLLLPICFHGRPAIGAYGPALTSVSFVA